MQDFTKFQESNGTPRRVVQTWERPCADYVKINFDAAFHENRGDAAYGYVVRSDEGDVIVAAAGKLTNVKSAIHAEVLACLMAVRCN